MDDPYETLGVARDASVDDIRRAYRKLAKTHHPDLNPGNKTAEERFKIVSAANEILSDPDKRGRFDRGEIDAAGEERPPQRSYRAYAEAEAGRQYSRSGSESGGWNDDDFADVFGRMFEDIVGARGKRPMRGRDSQFALTTDFLDAVIGATRRLTLPDGRTLDVKIPPGTIDGHVMRLRGQGSPGANGGADGDVLIEIHVTPHRLFRLDGRDIRFELPVTLPEAVLGGLVEIPTPGGKLRMRIPAGSDTGTELRLRGRGVPAHGDRAAGDLYVVLRVVLGPPDAALTAFLETWKPESPGDPRHGMEA